MQDMTTMLEHYKKSCAIIKEGIDRISAEIAGSGKTDNQALNNRRHLMYTELWAMEESIRAVEEYIKESPRAITRDTEWLFA